MVKLEKILCFIFTLLVLYLVNNQCVVEGIRNLNPFTNCIDDPDWYSLDKDGKKHYCNDIGSSASCYDMDPLQQEGWERCLKTCGNCADTYVSTSLQDTLAMYSGGNGEDFEPVDIDDSRKWLGKGVGDDDNVDVRGTITRDEEDDLVNIFDRLESMEGLYDMLLSSINSCLDCTRYELDDCPDKCNRSADGCVNKVTSSEPGMFQSCNGTELSCDYTINDTNRDDDTNIRNSTTTSRQYVKQKCESDGECSIMFPTYEFSCDNIPTPPSGSGPGPAQTRWCLTSEYYNNLGVSDTAEKMMVIDEAFTELLENYYHHRDIRDINTSKDDLYTAIKTGTYIPNNLSTLSTNVLNLIPTHTDDQELMVKLNNIKQQLDVLESDLEGGNLINLSHHLNNITRTIAVDSQNDCINQATGITRGLITVADDAVTVSSGTTDNTAWLQANTGNDIPLIAKEDTSSDNAEYCMGGLTIGEDVSVSGSTVFTLSTSNINIISNISSDVFSLSTLSDSNEAGQNTGVIKNRITNATHDNLLDNVALYCDVNSDADIMDKCHKVNVVNDDADNTKAKKACANYCKETNDKSNYISITGDNDDHCRCFIDLPLPNTVTSMASVLAVGDTSCTTGSELLDIGITSHRPFTDTLDPSDDIRNNCKNYFLLEKALTAGDIDSDADNRDDIINNITSMTDRISLYDVCPSQCNAVGCV
jgi:hypothetical protein